MAKAYEYVGEKDLLQGYKDAQQALLPRHEPMEEWERIARNQPYPNIPKNMPKVTDGTLASVIQEMPKRIIQQIPTGMVEGADESLNILASYLLNHEILPNNDEVAALIQKSWAMTSKCLTYGSQPVFVQTVKRGDYFGPDFTLPYIKDVFLEPGKLSDRDCNVIYLRSWWSPSDIKAIIARVQKLTKRAKARGDESAPDTGWVVSNLREAAKATRAKAREAETPNERGKNLDQGYVELVTAFQRGEGATFYTFCPDLPPDQQVVRRKTNNDPRGKIPIHFMYCNVDLSNPLGRGAVEMSGGMQNLLDSEVQSYQYMRALLMNPPIIIKGNVPNTVLKYAPQAQWRIGADPNAEVTPAKLETASLQQFPQNYGLLKSQILTLNSSYDNQTVGSDTGNPQFSKTPAGVKANDAALGVSDNYMRKQFEDTFAEICETEVNMYFANRSGVQEIEVDQETADKLKEINADIVDGLKVRVDFDTVTPALRFKVDAGSSEEEDDKEQIAGLQQLLKDSATDPGLPVQFAMNGKKFDISQVYEQLFERYGITGLEKIITDLPKVENPQTGEEEPDPQAIQQLMQQLNPAPPEPPQPKEDPNDPANHPLIKLMTSLQLKFADLPEDSKHELLKIIGIPSNEVTPTQQSLNTDKAKVVTDAAKHISGQQASQEQQAEQLAHQANESEAGRQHQTSQQESSQQATAEQAEAAREAQAEQQAQAQNSGQAGQ